jgi:hypothetical protein
VSDNIEQIFSTTIDAILNNLVSEYSQDGYSAEKAMIGPFMSRSKPAGSSISSQREPPKHRKSITVSSAEETIHITIFYDEITQDIMVGHVYPKNIENRYARIKLGQISDLLENSIRSYIRL